MLLPPQDSEIESSERYSQSESAEREGPVDADPTKTDISTSSDSPFFIPNLTYTREEEAKVIRTLDTRLFPWVLLTTFVLNMDRTNLSNAVSDNLPADLGFNTDTVNLAVSIYSVLFSFSCLAGAVVCKIVHPVRCK